MQELQQKSIWSSNDQFEADLSHSFSKGMIFSWNTIISCFDNELLQFSGLQKSWKAVLVSL